MRVPDEVEAIQMMTKLPLRSTATSAGALSDNVRVGSTGLVRRRKLSTGPEPETGDRLHVINTSPRWLATTPPPSALNLLGSSSDTARPWGASAAEKRRT